MKKAILSLLVLMMTFGYVNAQVYSLSSDGVELGDTVTIYGSPDASGIEFRVVFTNNDDVGASIKVMRHVSSAVEGSSNYFRWVQTNNPVTNLSGESLLVQPGESSPDDTFIAYYLPNGMVGKTYIEYNFFNISVENKDVKVVLEFDTTTDDINENILKNTKVSDIYPNPANLSVNIDYSLPLEVKFASVRIVNVLGSVVKEELIDTRDNKMQIDISDINDGIYFYSILINGEIYKTEKLIVR